MRYFPSRALIAGVVALSAFLAHPLAAQDAAYHLPDALNGKVKALAAAHPEACTVWVYGSSASGRDLLAVRLALPGVIDPDDRSAMLIVANPSGDRLIGSEVAADLMGRLLMNVAGEDEATVNFLTNHTLYIIPQANPDVAEFFFAEVKSNRTKSALADDRDRDGLIDEDGPDDLNGDGFITMMRVFDPEKADRMANADEPRLDAKPDWNKGESATFKLYVEGIDNDNDGEYNEDGPGGIEIDRNFMHQWQEHSDGVGRWQVSELESRALLQFVLDHQNIAVALTYGRHDNLSKTPDGKGKDDAGAPKNIESADVGIYKQVGEKFKELTELKKVDSAATDGAFFGWAYAQFGIPSFATPLWMHPEPEKPKDGKKDKGEKKEDEGDDDDDDEGGLSDEVIEAMRSAAEEAGFPFDEDRMRNMPREMLERIAGRMDIDLTAGSKKKKGNGGRTQSKDKSGWLAYSDDVRDGTGFVEWTPFDHPQLGKVEIGGWVPYFKTNPPADEIGTIAEKQVQFVLDLAGRFPKVHLTEPVITKLATGLYEIKIAIVNDGYFPAGTQMAVRNRRARPYVITLNVDNDTIMTGRRVHKEWRLTGSGGRINYRWIIQGDDDSAVSIAVFSDKFGSFDRTFNLTDNSNAGGDH